MLRSGAALCAQEVSASIFTAPTAGTFLAAEEDEGRDWVPPGTHKVLLGPAWCGVPSPGAPLFQATVGCTLHSAPAHLPPPPRKRPGLGDPRGVEDPESSTRPPSHAGHSKARPGPPGTGHRCGECSGERGEQLLGLAPPSPSQGPPSAISPELPAGLSAPPQWARPYPWVPALLLRTPGGTLQPAHSSLGLQRSPRRPVRPQVPPARPLELGKPRPGVGESSLAPPSRPRLRQGRHR